MLTWTHSPLMKSKKITRGWWRPTASLENVGRKWLVKWLAREKPGSVGDGKRRERVQKRGGWGCSPRFCTQNLRE